MKTLPLLIAAEYFCHQMELIKLENATLVLVRPDFKLGDQTGGYNNHNLPRNLADRVFIVVK